MASSGTYQIVLDGILNDAKVRAQIAALQKEVTAGVVGAAGGKGGKSGATMIAQTEKSAKKANKELNKMNKSLVGTQKAGKSAVLGLLDVTKKVVAFGAVTSAIQMATAGVGSMVKNVVDLDASLREYKKVSDLTGKGLEDFTNKAYKAGQATAKTGVEMIDAATEFKKMGYSDQLSLQLAKSATMFQNIADAEISAGDAATFINSQIKAFGGELSKFGDEAKQAQAAIDMINEVSNNYGVSSSDLQAALAKTSAAMKNYGNTMSESMALVTAGVEVMPKQASKVARAWRTIGANIVKAANGQDTWTSSSGKVTLHLKDQEGNLKSTYDIMSELNKSWGGLNEQEKSSIALALSGKNHMEVFSATMDNFTTAINANKTAQNSAGSAMRENEKYMDSIEGKVEALKSAWSDFSNAMLKSDTVKGVLSALTGILKVLASDAGQAAIKFALIGTVGVASLKGLVSIGGKAVKTFKAFAEVSALMSGTQMAISAGAASASASTLKLIRVVKLLANPYVLAAVAAGGFLTVLANLPTHEEKLGKGEKKLKKYEDTADKARQKIKELSKAIEEADEAGEDTTGLDKKKAKWDEILEKQEQYIATQEKVNKAEFQASLEETGDYGGKTTRQTVGGPATSKVSNKIDVLNTDYVRAYDEAASAAKNYAKARAEVQRLEDKGIDSGKEWRDAVKEEGRWADISADKQEKLADATKDLTKEQKQLKKYGTPDEMKDSAKTLKENIKNSEENAKQIQKMSDAYESLSSKISKNELLGKGKTKGTVKQLKTLGKELGIVETKGGKIKEIDVKKFSKGIKDMGGDTKDVKDALQALTREQPEVKLKVDGKTFKGNVEKAMQSLDKEGKPIKIPVQTEVSGKGKVDGLATAMESLKDKNVKAAATVSGKTKVTNLRTEINKLHDKTVTLTTVRKTKKVKEAHGTRHFASGIANDILGGNAIVNEQGFEIIQSPNGAMRIANAGKRGSTLIEEGSAVYTHGQSMRMLQKAGLTEAEILQGKEGDVGVFGIKKLEGFKKGKKKKKKKSAAQIKKEKQDAFDKELATLEYQRDYYNWTDQQFADKYKALYSKYKSYLSTEQAREYQTTVADIERGYVQEAIENNLDLFENQQKTYAEMTKIVNDYYKNGKINAEEYADYLKEINEQQVENTRQNYENQWDYISQYVQRQIDLQEEDNSLLEAQSELLKAQSQKVKVYREGQGWVYEQNAEAVREAQQNLKEYGSIWEEIQSIMDDVEAQANLQRAGVLAGSDLVSMVLGAGTDISTWRNIIGLIGANVGAYGLADDLGITDPSKITKATTINGQTFNIDNIALPNVSNANDFVEELTKLANQAVQTSMMR